MEAFLWVFTSGWASGINCYAVVLLLGLIGRFTDVANVPDALQRTDVLLAAGFLFLLDAIADKVPYVDSLWDSVHTVVRPTMGAVLGVLIAGDATTLGQAVAVVTGGGTALLSHSVKASLRAAVNTSPEPASNIAVSTAEDITVAAVVALSVINPWIAAAIAAVLLLSGLTLVAFLWRRITRFRTRQRARREMARGNAQPRAGAPPR